MAADPAGKVYLTGSASASGLPTSAGAVQPACGGGGCEGFGTGPGGVFTFPCPDAFVIKLDSTGQIVYATYLGGNNQDSGTAIAADSSGPTLTWQAQPNRPISRLRPKPRSRSTVRGLSVSSPSSTRPAISLYT